MFHNQSYLDKITELKKQSKEHSLPSVEIDSIFDENLQDEQEKNKTLQKELDELKQQLAESQKERASISSSDNSDSGVESDNLQKSSQSLVKGKKEQVIEQAPGDQKAEEFTGNIISAFRNDLNENKNALDNFSKMLDEFDGSLSKLSEEKSNEINNLTKTTQELRDEISRLQNIHCELNNDRSHNRKTIEQLTTKLFDALSAVLTEKLQKIINTPKPTTETQAEQKLSIFKQIIQFFSELLESLSKGLTSLGKGISSRLSEFFCFNYKTQNV
jgi:chromosome segregation ATPase